MQAPKQTFSSNPKIDELHCSLSIPLKIPKTQEIRCGLEKNIWEAQDTRPF
jgi:hypothetical protein